jgi:polyhydroxybutyrate depolymerase
LSTPASRKILKILLGAALLLIGMPVAFVLIFAVTPSLLYQTNGSILSNGEERDYLLYVPKSYDRAKPTPLVISMHAAMNWPAFQRDVSQWNKAADEHGFIVVYPAGTGFGPRTWEMNGWGNPSRMPDVRFISELIDKLQASYNIDPARIYANGLSNGGGMAFVLSCTLSGRIAAIGAVAAAQLLPWSWCKDATPVPMMAVHGSADRIVPYEGGRVWIAPEPFPSVPKWAASWAQRNRCAAKPAESTVAADITRTEYTSCAENAAVVLYTVQGGGHHWPGGRPLPAWVSFEMALFGLPVGSASDSIDTTGLMWAFFREHPLQKKQ